MAYGRIDAKGRLIRYGSKVKVEGAWVDIDGDEAAAWRDENGVYQIVDDGGESCPCGEGQIPVLDGYTEDSGEIYVQYRAVDIEDASKQDLRRAFKGKEVKDMTGDEKDALLQRLISALCAALVFAFPALGDVQTARLGSLKSSSVVVTNVKDVVAVALRDEIASTEYKLRYAEFDGEFSDTVVFRDSNSPGTALAYRFARYAALANVASNALNTTTYSWVRPDVWAIDVTIDAAEVAGSATIATSDTDAAGRVWTNVTYSTTYQMAAQCSPRMLDESSFNFPTITTWEALPDGGTIDEAGHFTATTSGLYRVSATASDGVTKYADVAISAERTVVTSNEYAYVDDDAAFLRHGCHTNALALLDAADAATTNTYGTTKYVIWNAYRPRFVSRMSDGAGGCGCDRPFAVSAHILGSASHYEAPNRSYGNQVFTDGVNSATVVKQAWYDLEAWAKTHGFTDAEATAVRDLSLILCTGDAIPDACRPYFISPEAFERRFGGDARMLTGWFVSQVSDWAMPTVFRTDRFTSWSATADTRRDLRELITAMRFDAYPPHGGDSGLPIFLLDGSREIVVAHHTTAMSCSANYITGFRIIKAFVEANGETIKEAE